MKNLISLGILLMVGCAFNSSEAQNSWEMARTLNHNDKKSNPLQPQPVDWWLMERTPGQSRWNLRGPQYPPTQWRATSHQKHLLLGKSMEAEFILQEIDAEMIKHADWLLFFQYHGKNGPEDQSVGQINVTLRFDDKQNHIPDGLVWALGVHGDNKTVTTQGKWSNKSYKYFKFEEKHLPVHWKVRLKAGGDGKTAAENGRVYDVGETQFLWKTAEMDDFEEVWYVKGSNYFPFLGKPDAGVQQPTFGTYCSNSLVSKSQKVIYSDMKITWLENWVREGQATELGNDL